MIRYLAKKYEYKNKEVCSLVAFATTAFCATPHLGSHGPLTCARRLCVCNHRHRHQGRIPFDILITHIFPVLLSLLKALLPLNTTDAAMLMKCILKTYWSATQYDLGLVLNAPEVGA